MREGKFEKEASVPDCLWENYGGTAIVSDESVA